MAFAAPGPRKLAARAGAAAKHKHPDADELRSELAAERIAAYVEKVLASAPPLTNDQRDRLAVLLRREPTSEVAA
ncbi:hypothetical protein ACFPK1_18935 [Actinomycetospora rhizophila]|uniref:PhiRv1 phage protein n=1 Tax=Actinomycetospora rhizophila TaxID=1416876 RepID=A0ABV9ZJK1_9PSEU